MERERHFVIAYDVADNRRRRVCAKVAYSYALGGQKSVLETVLPKRELTVLHDELLDSIDPDEDRIHVVEVKPDALMFGKACRLEYDKGAILL